MIDKNVFIFIFLFFQAAKVAIQNLLSEKNGLEVKIQRVNQETEAQRKDLDEKVGTALSVDLKVIMRMK